MKKKVFFIIRLFVLTASNIKEYLLILQEQHHCLCHQVVLLIDMVQLDSDWVLGQLCGPPLNQPVPLRRVDER